MSGRKWPGSRQHLAERGPHCPQCDGKSGVYIRTFCFLKTVWQSGCVLKYNCGAIIRRSWSGIIISADARWQVMLTVSHWSPLLRWAFHFSHSLIVLCLYTASTQSCLLTVYSQKYISSRCSRQSKTTSHQSMPWHCIFQGRITQVAVICIEKT